MHVVCDSVQLYACSVTVYSRMHVVCDSTCSVGSSALLRCVYIMQVHLCPTFEILLL